MLLQECQTSRDGEAGPVGGCPAAPRGARYSSHLNWEATPAPGPDRPRFGRKPGAQPGDYGGDCGPVPRGHRPFYQAHCASMAADSSQFDH